MVGGTEVGFALQRIPYFVDGLLCCIFLVRK
jgi:hypothetical protein